MTGHGRYTSAGRIFRKRRTHTQTGEVNGEAGRESNPVSGKRFPDFSSSVDGHMGLSPLFCPFGLLPGCSGIAPLILLQLFSFHRTFLTNESSGRQVGSSGYGVAAFFNASFKWADGICTMIG